MQWSDIRQAYPDQWLIVEAIEAHTDINNKRHLTKLAVIERCIDGKEAFQRYRKLHHDDPQREYYYLHTSREIIDIQEQQWLGIRISHAVNN